MNNKRFFFEVTIVLGTLIIFSCNLPKPITSETIISSNSNGVQVGETPIEQNGNKQNNLPIIKLESGRGYIFSTNSFTVDDRDVWWNAVQLVPARDCKMVPLGKKQNIEKINEVTFIGESQLQYQMFVGDSYGIEIFRNNKYQYALINIVEIDKELTLYFELLFPYLGKVIISQNP